MNAAHFHLMFYHLPIGGMLAGIGLLVGGRLSGNLPVQRAALWVLVAAGGLALPGHLTGDPAAELVQKLPGIHKEVIAAHETWGHASLSLCLVTGALAAFGLWTSRAGRGLGRAGCVAVLALSVLSLGSLGVTAWRGGSIRHSEFTAAEPRP